jgi:hypothetical protein
LAGLCPIRQIRTELPGHDVIRLLTPPPEHQLRGQQLDNRWPFLFFAREAQDILHVTLSNIHCYFHTVTVSEYDSKSTQIVLSPPSFLVLNASTDISFHLKSDLFFSEPTTNTPFFFQDSAGGGMRLYRAKLAGN